MSLTIVVSGMLGSVPGHGGATWALLQYVLGFRQLGHEVYLIDPVAPEALGRPETPIEATRPGAYFRAVAGRFGLDGRAALLVAGTRRTLGLPYDRLRSVARDADLLVNVSGTLRDDELTASIPRRLYLDIDPAFTQLWQAAQGVDMGFNGHTHFATIGLTIGSPDCPVPTCGREWIKTLQPIVLAHWPPAERVVHDAFTTVANWRAYGSIEHEGRLFGQKAHSLRGLMDLPTRTAERFALALAIHPDEARDLAALKASRWQLLDPARAAGTPARYRAFVRGSKAELGIAKSGYVLSRCGWFSDRSICYLASGRPVVAQETGFRDALPAGQGLFGFETGDGALAAVEAINRAYRQHARAARALAIEHFASERVLARLLDRVGATS